MPTESGRDPGDNFMKRHMCSSLFVCLLAASLLIPVPASAQQSCESLTSIRMPHVTFTSATAITPPWELPPTKGMFGTPAGQKVKVSFCRVEGFSAPTSDSHIGFEVWLPLANEWNGRLLGVGNPGFIGGVSRGALADIVQRGFVAISTDTGHTDDGYDWAAEHPEKLVDWGYRAVHETIVAAKQLMQTHYGKPVQYSYWSSCHNGGNQGLNEAQRYPDDFDGIVAGDPAYYVSRLQAGSLYIGWVSLKDGMKSPGYISPGKYPAMHRAALDACDAKDGLADGIIEDPPACHYDPVVMQCYGNDQPSCLSAAQVETARKIYAGAKFNDGSSIYSGFEPGTEMDWAMMAGGPDPLSLSTGYFKGMVFKNPDWDYRTFDPDRDTRLAEDRTGAAVDGIDPNLKPFQQSGGKLLIYQSWNETTIPPRSIIDYYKRVNEAMGGLRQTQDFVRLFMVAGMGMCPGFGNAKDFDALEAMQQWVEKGIAPERILAQHRDNNREIIRTRPACAYPKAAKYTGKGDPKDAASFDCR
jgi:feruloyl esterase